MSVRDKVFIDIVANTKQGIKNMAEYAAAAGSAAVILKKTIDATKEMVDLFKVQEQAEAKLNQTLKSTGFAAGLAADEITNMASALQAQTLFGDEAIINAQSLLLTFKDIGADTFPRATEAILDMSQAMGTGLKETTIQVGKALNDPILGVTALRRVGVQLTDQQEDMIKTMVDVGDVAGAQKVILGELESQFGGVAKSAGETATGALEQFKNAMNDGKEIQGEFVAQGMEPILRRFTDLVSASNDGKNALMDLNNALNAIATGGDAGDVTNEIRTQLAIVKEMEEGFLNQLGIGKEKLQQARENLGVLIDQHEAYKDQVAQAKELAAQAEKKAEWDAVISGELEKRAVKDQQIRDAAEEANQILFDSLEPLEQQLVSLDEQAKALNEVYQNNLKNRHLSGEELDARNEELEIIRQAIELTNQKYREALAAYELQKESMEVAEEEEEQQQEFYDAWIEREEAKQEKLSEAHALKLEQLEEEREARQEYNDYIEETQERLIELEEEKQKKAREAALQTFSVMSDAINAIGNLSGAMYDQQLQDISEAEAAAIAALDKQEMSEEEYGEAKKEILEEYDEKRKQIQRQQAIEEKAMALAMAVINAAAGVLKALSTTGIPGAIAAGVIGAIQVAAIAAQPIPAATGYDDIVTQPTMFLAGEAGAEQVQITPLEGPNINGPQGGATHVTVMLDSAVIMDAIGRASRDGRLIIDGKAVRS